MGKLDRAPRKGPKKSPLDKNLKPATPNGKTIITVLASITHVSDEVKRATRDVISAGGTDINPLLQQRVAEVIEVVQQLLEAAGYNSILEIHGYFEKGEIAIGNMEIGNIRLEKKQPRT